MKKRNYFLPFFLAAFIMVLLLCSCSTNKHIKKSKETTQITTETTSTSTITEQADTCITTKGKELTGDISLADLINGDTLKEETPELSIQTAYDPVKKKVVTKAVAKPQKVPFKFNRVTVKQEKRKETTKRTVHVKEKGVRRVNYWWLLWMLLIPAGWLCWRFLKKIKPGC